MHAALHCLRYSKIQWCIITSRSSFYKTWRSLNWRSGRIESIEGCKDHLSQSVLGVILVLDADSPEQHTLLVAWFSWQGEISHAVKWTNWEIRHEFITTYTKTPNLLTYLRIYTRAYLSTCLSLFPPSASRLHACLTDWPAGKHSPKLGNLGNPGHWFQMASKRQ